MSEFQYYEFQAIDRPLTRAEMAELRKYSTRARITPTSFVNDLQSGELGDHDVEPPVPAGLGGLSGAQQAMAEFLRIDEALLAAAAEHSPQVTRRTLKRADIDRRVRDLPLKEKEKALADYIAGRPAALQRLQDAVFGPTTSDSGRSGAPRRTAGEIIRAARLTL